MKLRSEPTLPMRLQLCPSYYIVPLSCRHQFLSHEPDCLGSNPISLGLRVGQWAMLGVGGHWVHPGAFKVLDKRVPTLSHHQGAV